MCVAWTSLCIGWQLCRQQNEEKGGEEIFHISTPSTHSLAQVQTKYEQRTLWLTVNIKDSPLGVRYYTSERESGVGGVELFRGSGALDMYNYEELFFKI